MLSNETGNAPGQRGRDLFSAEMEAASAALFCRAQAAVVFRNLSIVFTLLDNVRSFRSFVACGNLGCNFLGEILFAAMGKY